MATKEKIGPTRSQRRMGTKGKDARRRARDAYKATHGVPGRLRASDRSHDRYKPHVPEEGLVKFDLLFDYRSKTRDELRKIAADRNLAGRGSMTKDQLVEALSKTP